MAQYCGLYKSTLFHIRQAYGENPHLPNLASVTPFVRQLYAYKVSSMQIPNQLSREAIEEFKAIYQGEFSEALSDDEVQEIAMRLLRFFGILNKGQ